VPAVSEFRAAIAAGTPAFGLSMGNFVTALAAVDAWPAQIQSDARLPEDDRSAGGQFDQRGDEQQDGRQQDQHGRRNDDV
jgi:hypothetical protein